MGLITELLEIYVEVDEGVQKSLRACLVLVGMLGLLIQSDLRPWTSTMGNSSWVVIPTSKRMNE